MEPLERLSLRQHDSSASTQQLLDLALLKLSIFADIRAAQLLLQRFGNHHSDIVGTILTSHSSEMDPNWRQMDTLILLQQARQLLTCAHRQNQHVLPGMLNPKPLLDMDPAYYSPGSREEASLTIRRSYHWWKINRVAMNFVRNFAQNIKDSSLSLD